ncbi:MAG TPA: acetylxylan esterase, partial [Verrucomicrobiota bacterium]|nr:acetylxylan esterase [Verrucomicrobiota bacterium]
MKTFLIGVIASLLIGASTMAQDKDAFKGSDTLPKLLMSENGQEIKTLDEWQNIRRPELLKIFTKEMYGCMPGLPEEVKYTVFESTTNALGGIATRKQITISMVNKGHQTSVDL